MQKLLFRSLLVLFFSLLSIATFSQKSVARQWNEVLLDAIRVDYARPTVHARNLFHSSGLMYDAWAIFDTSAKPYFLGNVVNNYSIGFEGFESIKSKSASIDEIISYGCYRLLKYRFRNSPGLATSFPQMDELFLNLGYDSSFYSVDYSSGNPASLGNYLAQSIIDYGLQDNANGNDDYANIYYQTFNDPLLPDSAGNPTITDLNRWQPLALDYYVDQSGNIVPKGNLSFLGPEWGKVSPFALSSDDLEILDREGNDYWVYHNPGLPTMMGDGTDQGSDEYRWGFDLVTVWSSHLDPSDGVMLDISPASFGDIQAYPTTHAGLRDFYNLIEGGDAGLGRDINPYTGAPYQPQVVPRGDYARVLAEFWADGPASETPPGHWFTILNYVSDHPLIEKKFEGQGDVLSDLEWDVKAYFTLGGAVHDAAVTAWGIKGYYDFVRPISAFRAMADLGQSSDVNLPHYDPRGVTLITDKIELVELGDVLAGINNEHVSKIKVKSWKGPSFITDPKTDMAGVDWILAENWWPYQRPSFVTPPFAGYVSGHSVFSRAAAEVMTAFTGDAYFPGGMGEFLAPKNEFLVFEEGPSQDITLQWATYRDASDQTSLSRIWGGIHPPVDDVPGRLIGIEIGLDAFAFAKSYFGDVTTGISDFVEGKLWLYPNPAKGVVTIGDDVKSVIFINPIGQEFTLVVENKELDISSLKAGVYVAVSGNRREMLIVE